MIKQRFIATKNPLHEVEKWMTENKKRVYSEAELYGLLEEHRQEWGFAPSIRESKLIERLVNKDILKIIELSFEQKHTPMRRYVYKSPTPYEIACSIHPRAYISHYPAMFLLGLTTQVPKTIYVTHEQSVRHFGHGELTQDGIANAFSRPQRRSESAAVYGDSNIILLKGKNTGRAGIQEFSMDQAQFSCTSLERTLIDITVRPNYAGGAFMVLEAYRQALEMDLSLNKLNARLKNMDYLYPYHQCIGFYLEKAGYSGKQMDLFKSQPMEFDFYLDYELSDPAYSKEWRLYYPKEM